MAKTCVTEKTAARQRWMEQGLQELMRTRRFEQITVTDLCQHLGLSRRSFYRYFRDLDDVLDSLMHHTFQDLALADTIQDILEMQRGYEFWLERRELLDALAYSGLSNKLIDYTLQFTNADSLKEYMDQKDFDMDIQKETRLFITTGMTSLIIAWHAEGFRKTPEQMAQIAQRLLLQPVLKK